MAEEEQDERPTWSTRRPEEGETLKTKDGTMQPDKTKLASTASKGTEETFVNRTRY